MRDAGESDLMRYTPPHVRQPVASIRDNAAKLRRAVHGPVTARYLAILATLEEAREQLAFSIDAIHPDDQDGVEERHAVDLADELCDRVRSIIGRQALTEVRRVIKGERRPARPDDRFA